jgi:hypothetical protein
VRFKQLAQLCRFLGRELALLELDAVDLHAEDEVVPRLRADVVRNLGDDAGAVSSETP